MMRSRRRPSNKAVIANGDTSGYSDTYDDDAEHAHITESGVCSRTRCIVPISEFRS